MDDESVAAFQNPSQTMSGSLGQTAEELKNVETVNPSEIEMPQEYKQTVPEPTLGPYGTLIHQGPSPQEVRVAQEKEERNRIISRLQRLNLKKNFPTIQFNEGDSLYTLRKLNRLRVPSSKTGPGTKGTSSSDNFMDIIRRATS